MSDKLGDYKFSIFHTLLVAEHDLSKEEYFQLIDFISSYFNFTTNTFKVNK